MMKILTKHAVKRCQQRDIPYDLVKFIIDHGDRIPGDKKTKHFINKNAMDNLKRSYPEFTSKYDKKLVTTAVVTSGKKIITAMKIKHYFRW